MSRYSFEIKGEHASTITITAATYEQAETAFQAILAKLQAPAPADSEPVTDWRYRARVDGGDA